MNLISRLVNLFRLGEAIQFMHNTRIFTFIYVIILLLFISSCSSRIDYFKDGINYKFPFENEEVKK